MKNIYNGNFESFHCEATRGTNCICFVWVTIFFADKSSENDGLGHTRRLSIFCQKK